jgi:Group II intron, maturase-specific domain
VWTRHATRHVASETRGAISKNGKCQVPVDNLSATLTPLSMLDMRFVASIITNPVTMFCVVGALIVWAACSAWLLRRGTTKLSAKLADARRRIERTEDSTAFASSYEKILAELAADPVQGPRSREYRTLRGWFEYFKHSYWPTFRLEDGFVRRRLRSILRKRSHRKGSAKANGADQSRWPNAYFTALRLFCLEEAHAAACRSSRR